jgi:tetratricopeptide (TPR) repeat protein
VQALLEAAKTRTRRFDDAQISMAQGRYREAREALQRLAAEDPATKKFRVQLHLATGLEHRAAARFDEAIRELERAVALDPECADAAEALRRLQEQKRSGGFLSKLFGR